LHPILYTLELSPEVARLLGVAASVVLSLFIIWDGERTGGSRRVSTMLQALAFFLVSLGVVLLFMTPDRLPNPLILDIRSWGVFAIIGMVSCFLIQRSLGKQIGLRGEHILSLWVYGGLGAVFGARALHVAVNWSWYAPNPVTAIAFWDGGMVYIGGVAMALVVGIIYARTQGLGLAAFDVLAIGVALSQGLGRVGCFLAGCCYGRETTLPVGVRFGEGSIAHYAMVQMQAIAPEVNQTPPLHPTQLYEAGLCFLIGVALLVWYKTKRPAPGVTICAYFIAYSVVRFLLELLRNDPERQFLVRIPEDSPLILSTSQTAGIVFIVIASWVLSRLKRRGEETPTSTMTSSALGHSP
jgi:phosphatidylglycerol---prolipoprotein diacylglyceryl transferase